MYQALGQSGYLNRENLLATFVQLAFTRRHKRMRFYRTGKSQIAGSNKCGRDMLHRMLVAIHTYAAGESGIRQTFSSQTLHIYLADHKLFFK